MFEHSDISEEVDFEAPFPVANVHVVDARKGARILDNRIKKNVRNTDRLYAPGSHLRNRCIIGDIRQRCMRDTPCVFDKFARRLKRVGRHINDGDFCPLHGGFIPNRRSDARPAAYDK